MPNFPHYTRMVIDQAHKQSSSSPHDPGTHFDRTAVIVLSVILFLILVAVAWYLYLHFTRKRRDDIESQLAATLEDEQGRVVRYGNNSIDGRDATRNGRSDSMFKLQPVVTRRDSVATTARSESTERKRWRSTSPWPCRNSESLNLRVSAAPSSSLDVYTLPLSSTERPLPTYTRWQPRKGNSDPLPMLPPSYTTPSRSRSSSLTASQGDTQWRGGATRRSSNTTSRKRLSILETVLEPEVSNTNKLQTIVLPGRAKENNMEDGGSHASWKGSRCELVTYDWTRPADAEVGARSDLFKDVIWSQNEKGSD